MSDHDPRHLGPDSGDAPDAPSPADRRLELLCDRALTGLDPAEAAELDRLLAAGEGDTEAFDLAAAAIDLAALDEAIEPLPAALRARIEAVAPAALATPVVTMEAPAPRPPVTMAGGGAGVVPLVPRRDVFFYAGWLAAAACFALAVGSWLSRPEPTAGVTPPPPAPSAAPAETPRPPSPSRERESLLTRAKDVVQVAWTATADPAGRGASGDVVWSEAEQRGYMRFHGLAPNDPRRTQFQLWIFDKGRDDRYPVDGGVFDLEAATGDVVVPIVAKLRVDAPVLFAVTVEAPGGVVVSKREHIVVTAALKSTG